MTRRTFEERFQDKKSQSTLEALFRAARLANERALEELNRRPHKGPAVRPTHTALFPHIDLEGTRISTLADRVGISKQATSELVEELDEMGLVERIPDPTDGRAKLVRYSKEGRKHLLGGLDLLKSVEDQLAGALGKRKMRNLRNTLQDLIELLAPPATP